jgi:hypothetical protein
MAIFSLVHFETFPVLAQEYSRDHFVDEDASPHVQMRRVARYPVQKESGPIFVPCPARLRKQSGSAQPRQPIPSERMRQSQGPNSSGLAMPATRNRQQVT